MPMTFDDHTQGIGRIVTNPQSLGLYLRIFLCESRGEQPRLPAIGDANVQMTTLTNCASLNQLIAAYNAGLTVQEKNHAIGTEIVTLRDAIAHGRILGIRPDVPVTLYKFGQPIAGRVPVQMRVEISEDWLSQKMQLVHDQVLKIAACANSRGYRNIPAHR